jgi:hypothetical protein
MDIGGIGDIGEPPRAASPTVLDPAECLGGVDRGTVNPMENQRVARPDDQREAERLLGTYLRDHFAGSTAGLALVRRLRAANAGTALDDVLAPIEAEIAEDRRALQAMMSGLGVEPSVFKSAVGAVAELVGRAKINGRVMRRSPSSSVVELEGLAAGIATKRNLWRALRTIADRDGLDAEKLDTLIDRATAQYDRVVDAHDRAAGEAFARPGRAPLDPGSTV